MTLHRLFSPAAERNATPLGDVLENVLPPSGTVLEIASGSGQHAVAFARRFPSLRWQPSDPNAGARASIAAYRGETGLPNLNAPWELDVTGPRWWEPVREPPAAIVAVNLLHISPWAATEGLWKGAAVLLAPGAPLVLYGPFLEADVPTAPSNLEFDRSLRSRDPHWGIRTLDAVAAEGRRYGFERFTRVAMPANNLTVAFRR